MVPEYQFLVLGSIRQHSFNLRHLNIAVELLQISECCYFCNTFL